jgi:hypothetical protein
LDQEPVATLDSPHGLSLSDVVRNVSGDIQASSVEARKLVATLRFEQDRERKYHLEECMYVCIDN